MLPLSVKESGSFFADSVMLSPCVPPVHSSSCMPSRNQSTHERNPGKQSAARHHTRENHHRTSGSLWLGGTRTTRQYPLFPERSFHQIQPEVSAQNSMGTRKGGRVLPLHSAPDPTKATTTATATIEPVRVLILFNCPAVGNQSRPTIYAGIPSVLPQFHSGNLPGSAGSPCHLQPTPFRGGKL